MKAGNGKDRYYDGAGPKPGDSRYEGGRTDAQEAVRRANDLGSRNSVAKLINRPAFLLAAGIAGLIALVLLAYLLGSSSQRGAGSPAPVLGSVQSQRAGGASENTEQSQLQPSTSARVPNAASSGSDVGAPGSARGVAGGSGQVGSRVQGPETPAAESWPVRLALVALALALASLLGAILAFRPRRDKVVLQRRPELVQTEILLAVLGAGIVIVASMSLGLAAAVIAVALLAGTRPAVRDPKESTVMLVCGAVGVACGAERWEVAILLAVLAFVILWVLEAQDQKRAVRTLEVSVETQNVDETNEVLRELFEKNHQSAEFRRLDRQAPDSLAGTIVYQITSAGEIGLDRLADEIFSSDPENVYAVNSHQSRTRQYEAVRV